MLPRKRTIIVACACLCDTVSSQQRRLQDWYDQTPPQTAQPDDESSSLRDDDSGLAAVISDLALDSVSDEVCGVWTLGSQNY